MNTLPLRKLPWLLALGLSACSAESVKRDFDAFAADANSCQAADECTVVFTDCPLGCFVAVRADRKSDVEAEASRLTKLYRASGQSCAYDCVMPGEVTCTAQRCAVAPAP